MWWSRLVRFRSLKSRLALWVFMPVLLLIAIDMAVTHHSSNETATLVQQQLLHGSAKIISQQLIFADESYELVVPPAAFELFRSEYKDRVYYAVQTKDGKLISGGDELPLYHGSLQSEEEEYFVTTVHDEPVRVVAYAHPLTNSSSGDYVITQVAQTLRGHGEFAHDLVWMTLRGHLLLLSIMIGSLFVTLRWTLEPLMEFGRTLLQRQPGSLEKLATEDAPTELEPVIRALNDYAAKLANTLASYEKFVSDTAHHLRTSFAIINSQVDFGKRNDSQDNVQREVLDAIQKALRHCTRVINQLLVLASVEHTRHDTKIASDVQLSEIIVAVIEEMAPLAQQRGIELGVEEFDESVRLTAPKKLLHEVFANLINNAIQHMGKPGTVTISLWRDETSAWVRLIDNGIGIPPEFQQKVFERFFQIDESNTDSSGLGLAIVKEICDSLNAAIVLSPPPSGTGLRVTIRFPILLKAQ